MDRPDLDAVVSRAQCVISLLVRAQIEEQLALAPSGASRWAGALERLESWTREEALESALVREERTLLATPWGGWSREDMSAAAWRIEGLAVLLYALGRFDLDEASVTTVEPQKVQSTTSLLPSKHELKTDAVLRPFEDLDRLRRITGVWRWRAKTELLHRRGASPTTGEPYEVLVRRAAERAGASGLLPVVEGDFAVKGRPFAQVSESDLRMYATVALERGRAADWLCGKGAWDAPPEL